MATPGQLDAFRELRTRLLALAAALGQPHFSTLLVPVTAGSGASFVARNLAAAFALQEGQSALLVDCDLRHPHQHQVLGSGWDSGGLISCLEQPRTSIESVVCPTRVPGLYLIPAGRPPRASQEYFSSKRVKEILTRLRGARCPVILDGPPCDRSPDALLLSELVDIVILVARYGRHTGHAIAQAAARFPAQKLAGVVFNEHG